MEARFAFLRQWQRQVYEGGWAGLSWPKEYGGRGATLMEKAIFTEKPRHLPKILSGEGISCKDKGWLIRSGSPKFSPDRR